MEVEDAQGLTSSSAPSTTPSPPNSDPPPSSGLSSPPPASPPPSTASPPSSSTLTNVETSQSGSPVLATVALQTSTCPAAASGHPSQTPQSPPRTAQALAESSQATPPRNNRSPSVRKNKFYFQLQVTPATLPSDKKATSALKLEAYRQGLVKSLEALVSIDDTLALWPYEFPNSTESELLNNPSALGTTIHQIQKFFDEFHINKFVSRSYVNCLLGFNMDFDLFMQSAGAMLEDILARIDKRSLQVPHITPLGWLFGSHEDISIPVLEQVLNNIVACLAPHQVPAVQYGLSFRPIWDGVGKKSQTKEQDRTKWAIHVDAIAEIALTSKAYLKQVLTSPDLKAHTNLPLLLVPILQKKTSTIEAEEIKRAIARHSTVLQSISKSFSSKILLLSRPLASLSNATLCTTLMAVVTPEGKKLFLSAYPSWNGQGFIISYPTIYAKQAYDYVEYLPAYLSHAHGDEVY